jgi:transposase
MVSMNLNSFQALISTENRARLFFRKACWKKGLVFCTRCKSRKIYRILGKRYRCKRCKYTFTDFSGRWINKLNISPKDWLWVIKLFELDVSARKASKQLALSYPTVLRAFDTIRYGIIANSEDRELLLQGEVEIDESYFGGRRKGKRGRGAAGKVPVFGILERAGVVKVDVVRNVKAESLLNMTVKTVKRGSIVYTDKFHGYDALMFCGYRHLRVDHAKRFSSGKVYINGLEGFWSFAKERIIKFHGVSKEKFPLYLKEMEFRYNNRQKEIFTLLTQSLCNLVPKPL